MRSSNPSNARSTEASRPAEPREEESLSFKQASLASAQVPRWDPSIKLIAYLQPTVALPFDKGDSLLLPGRTNLPNISEVDSHREKSSQSNRRVVVGQTDTHTDKNYPDNTKKSVLLWRRTRNYVKNLRSLSR